MAPKNKHTSVSLLVVGVQAVLEVEEAEEYPSSSLALASFSWVTVCSISCRDQNQYYILFVSLFAMMTEHVSQYCIGYFPVLYYKLKLHLTPLTSYCSTDYLPQESIPADPLPVHVHLQHPSHVMYARWKQR